jgi:hypothetical protein
MVHREQDELSDNAVVSICVKIASYGIVQALKSLSKDWRIFPEQLFKASSLLSPACSKSRCHDIM